MKKIACKKIADTVSELSIRANTHLRRDVLAALELTYKKEKRTRPRYALEAIIHNAYYARKHSIAICQDTGLACVFVELGNNVQIIGDLNKAIQQGLRQGYIQGCLRNSVVLNPLSRKKPGFSPGVIHIDIVPGNNLKITVLPKGFGSENKTRLKMFLPTAGLNQIEAFVLESVRQAGADACPPYIVGVGIGGTSEYATFLAKKALLRKITKYRLPVTKDMLKIEYGLLQKINKLHIGPMGLGGEATCLGVHILTYPTHIAGLPVAVNISCHALRSATKIL